MSAVATPAGAVPSRVVDWHAINACGFTAYEFKDALMNTLSRCVAVSVLFAAVCHLCAGDAVPSVPIRSLPCGGVVDATGEIGFVIGKHSDIEALDLDSGKVLWTSKDATKPLAFVGKKLIALAPEKGKDTAVRIVVLDGITRRQKILESEVISFPDWLGKAPSEPAHSLLLALRFLR